ncbi:MAG: hypothetical protein HY852_00345 [Bradyrhizobium sp.]|uniref:hypothetical protein n=1 Tax=Bradyrhizobium sp. TaxID=376 RepID=UPI0025C5DBFA|nr:hypothetical protein [Bradyrhizobium sp.]MBI5260250.1 hypothetical protein [Bradyrhizobium sp.]
MDLEKEIHALSAETLAHSIMIGNILSKLARNPDLRSAIAEGFDQSLDVAQTVAVQFGTAASPDHTLKALKIIEEMRSTVLGAGPGPNRQIK